MVSQWQDHMDILNSNVFKPLIIHNILQSIEIMSDSFSKTFAMYCIKGIKADKIRIKNLLDKSLMLVTALAPKNWI